MTSNYTTSRGNTFDFPLNDIIKDPSEYYPELKTITIEEMEKLREIIVRNVLILVEYNLTTSLN